MALRPAPARIGVLHDFPQVNDSFERALRTGLAETVGDLDRDVELLTEAATGLPFGSEHAVRTGFATLAETDVLAIVGPSISDNALIARDLAAGFEIPAINWSGGERTRGPWMFQYQVGSLEEEPPLVAARLVERGIDSVAVLYDRSPVGTGYLAHFETAAARVGVDVAAALALPSLADDVSALVDRARRVDPAGLVYFGLGAASHAVAVARKAAHWEVPVLANSALMFGYARPDWRDDWSGWEYVDAIDDDNPQRVALAERDRGLAAAPTTCAGYDIGRLLGSALQRADHLTRAGVRSALEGVKRLPATTGSAGTYMGLGVYDHAALKGDFLVLREWRDGATVQVPR